MGVTTIALLLFASTADSGKPPTLDPTFGMPIPKPYKVAQRRTKDAEWIWSSTVRDTQTVYFRHALSLTQKPIRAKLFITADNFFSLTVNGVPIGATAASSNDSLVWATVREFDVSSQITAGQNEFAVKGMNAGGPAGMLFRLELDGKPILLSDKSWKVSDSPASEDWQSSAFDDSSWPNATPEGAVGEGVWGGQLTHWPVQLNSAAPYLAHLSLPSLAFANAGPELKWIVSDLNVPLKKPKPSSGKWTVVYDFGKELTGRARVTSASPVNVKLGSGESAEEAIEKPYTSAEVQLGKEPEYTAYTAMRYVAITFPADVDTAEVHVSYDHLYYPVSYQGSFDCSDALLTKIWYTGAYTAHLCMQEDIWDAPKRDRARWMGDLHISGEVINNVFLDRFLMEQTMTRLRQEAQGGRPESEMPAGNVNGIPGYSCAWIAGLADFYRHTGDAEYLKKQHQALMTMLDFMHSELGTDGLFANTHRQWPFVDWAPQFNGDTPQARAATHLFYVKAAREAAFLFHELADTMNAEKADAWAAELTEVAQSKLAGPDGTFGDRRQENAMAIYSGVAKPAQIATIYSQVLQPDSRAWGYVASPYYNNYVLDAITTSGHMLDAMKFVRSYWGGMLAEGATSWWEGYDLSWPKERFHSHLQADNGTGTFVSLSHGWSAGPTNWLTERVLGVRSTGGGFRTCEINPDLGDLAWASGSVPTPHGALKIRVDAAGARYKVKATIPSGVEARLGSVILKPGTQTVFIPAKA